MARPTNNEIKVHVVDYGRASLYMRYTDPLTGKQVTRSTGTKNDKEAAKEAAKWEAEIQDGRFQNTPRVSWDAFWERYETEVLTALSPKTMKKSATVRSVAEQLMNPQRMDQITGDWLSRFSAAMRERGNAEDTITGYLSHLRSALNWAVEVGVLASVPKMKSKRHNTSKRAAKGRAVTTEEFERMLAVVPKVVGDADADAWRFYLRGLWWSGLRLEESTFLFWDRDDRLKVVMGTEHPMLWIPHQLEKGKQDRVIPMAPEFSELLEGVPEADRRGRVFRLHRRCHGPGFLSADRIGHVVTKIGKRAGVVVWKHPLKDKQKYASAHDLRRAFGFRWSERVMPAVLQQMMRHETIETTMRYYVTRNAAATAATVWNAYRGVSGNTLGNTQPENAENKRET